MKGFGETYPPSKYAAICAAAEDAAVFRLYPLFGIESFEKTTEKGKTLK